MRSHSIGTSPQDRMRAGPGDYDVDDIGLNYRPTDLSSAIGRVQLGRLTSDRVARRVLTRRYHDLLTGLAGVGLPFTDRRGDSAHHLMPIVLPDGVNRGRLRAALRDEGIQTSVHYPPAHRLSYYAQRFVSADQRFPVTDAIAQRLLSLPIHRQMLEGDVTVVVETLDRSLRMHSEES
jgi:dTDP-4-amino-4,6-dideoxygalactose transaminase